MVAPMAALAAGEKMLGAMKEVRDKVKKIAEMIERASPALQQQMIVLRKSFELFLRPIGDFIAKLMRPLALWLLKVAMKWYQLFGGGNANNTDAAAKADLIEALKEEKKTAEARGDKGLADEIQKKIDELLTPDTSFWGRIGKAWEDSVQDLSTPWAAMINGWTSEWNNLIVPAFEQTVESLTGYWNDTVFPALQKLGTSINGVVNDTILPSLMALGTSILGVWNDTILPAWDVFTSSIKNWANDIWTTYISPAWESVKEWANKIWDTFISPGFDSVKNWANDLWTLITQPFKDIIKKIKNWNPFSNKDDTKSGFGGGGAKGNWASGGEIPKTGMYKLHAGETVVSAGETKRAQGNSFSFNNNITISGSISSDIDIRQLARKLAEWQEVELRRRASYI